MSKYIETYPHSLPVAMDLVDNVADMADQGDHRGILADNRPVPFTISTQPRSRIYSVRTYTWRTRSLVLLLRSLIMVTKVFDKFTYT
jgi:hypothetical protein